MQQSIIALIPDCLKFGPRDIIISETNKLNDYGTIERYSKREATKVGHPHLQCVRVNTGQNTFAIYSILEMPLN